MKFFQLWSVTSLLIFSLSANAAIFEKTHYEVCFTPYENCTQSIVERIHHAKKNILVQAYSFTSRPIGKALVNAHKRGVDVRMIFDKSQYMPHQYSSARFFTNHHIASWIDDKVAAAHNKVMIIDDEIVITGSFNFTRAAQEKNAENVLIIWNALLAQQYIKNWHKRLKVSVRV